MIVVLGAVLSAGPPALAQEGEPGVVDAPVQLTPEEEKKQRAAKHYNEAERLFAAELYAAAIEQYKAAFELYPAPAIAYNIAKSYERIGDPYGCIDFYDLYLRLFKEREGRHAPDTQDVLNSITKCRLGAKVTLRVETEPPGAAIYIDDKKKLLGQTPYETKVDAGSYNVYLDLAGYLPFERQVTVKPAEPLQLVFKLEKQKRVGHLVVSANIVNAQVFLDGQNVGLTPYQDAIELEEGPHQVTLAKDEYLPYSGSVEVVMGEQHRVHADLWLADAPATWKGGLGWPSLLLGVLVAGGGAFSGNYANQFFQGSDEFKQFAMLEKVGYGVGGGLFAAGLTLAILEALDDKAVKDDDVPSLALRARRPAIVPIVGMQPGAGRGAPGGASLGARVSF